MDVDRLTCEYCREVRPDVTFQGPNREFDGVWLCALCCSANGGTNCPEPDWMPS